MLTLQVRYPIWVLFESLLWQFLLQSSYFYPFHTRFPKSTISNSHRSFFLSYLLNGLLSSLVQAIQAASCILYRASPLPKPSCIPVWDRFYPKQLWSCHVLVWYTLLNQVLNTLAWHSRPSTIWSQLYFPDFSPTTLYSHIVLFQFPSLLYAIFFYAEWQPQGCLLKF